MATFFKDFIRLAVAVSMASISTNFFFDLLKIKRGGLIFTESYDFKHAGLHGLLYFILLCWIFGLLGKFPYFKKK